MADCCDEEVQAAEIGTAQSDDVEQAIAPGGWQKSKHAQNGSEDE